jgi:membrane protein YqaA with SNARE-associated domain
MQQLFLLFFKWAVLALFFMFFALIKGVLTVFSFEREGSWPKFLILVNIGRNLMGK